MLPLLLLLLPWPGLARDFFTGMDSHIGCFYDQASDRWGRPGHYIPPGSRQSFSWRVTL
jgi:hypothetical protein